MFICHLYILSEKAPTRSVILNLWLPMGPFAMPLDVILYPSSMYVPIRRTATVPTQDYCLQWHKWACSSKSQSYSSWKAWPKWFAWFFYWIVWLLIIEFYFYILHICPSLKKWLFTCTHLWLFLCALFSKKQASLRSLSGLFSQLMLFPWFRNALSNPKKSFIFLHSRSLTNFAITFKSMVYFNLNFINDTLKAWYMYFFPYD